MSVRSLDFVMKNPLNEKEKTTYSCNGFAITEDCSAKRTKECSKDLGSCIKSNQNKPNQVLAQLEDQFCSQKIKKNCHNCCEHGHGRN